MAQCHLFLFISITMAVITTTSAQRFPGRGFGRPNRPSWVRVPNSGPGRPIPYRRVFTPNASPLMQDYSWSNGQFGLNLYREVAKEFDNFAISPFSVHSALSMLLLGTAGPAKAEMIRAMKIRSPIHDGFNAYNSSIYANNINATLMIANGVYLKRRLYVRRAYVNKLRRFYKTIVNRFTDTEPHVPINQWVAEKTRDMIQDFLGPQDINSDTLMMLLNAVYFKAKWEDEFDPYLTTLKQFTDTNGTKSDVYMMTNSGQYQMAPSEHLGATVIRLPYRGDRYSLYVILPNVGESLFSVESRLTHEILNNTLHFTWDQIRIRVRVQIPKFSLDTDAAMQESLEAMGIRKIFNPDNRSSFRRLSSRRDLHVSNVKHRCIVDVDEEGTEAAAVTGISVSSRRGFITRDFNANRPFMFVLRDDMKHINLFMGRYVNPQGDNLSE